MASIRVLRNRIKSVKNIAQITKAMEMVAASKMKKAQLQALSGKLYAQKIYDMVMKLGGRFDSQTHPLLRKPERAGGKRLVIFISSNKGLCGSLNTNLFRFFLSQYAKTETIDCVTLGKKGAYFLAKTGVSVTLDFSEEDAFSTHIPALAEMAVEKYLAREYDGVDIVYNEFFSALLQKPSLKALLPLHIPAVENQADASHGFDMLIEPSVSQVFDQLLPHYIENQIRDAVLEGEASEHSARMVAMRNATDNALARIDDLTLMYNKARQEKITYEISDMITARLTVQ